MKDLFARRATPPGRAREVKAWVSEHLGLAEADLVTVAELACHEPGCPPVETVVTVHASGGERRSWHLHKSLAEIDEKDVVTVLSSENGH